MSLKKWLTLSIALMVLGALLAVIGYSGREMLMVIGLVPLAVGLLVYDGMCRCPECGAPLGRSPGSHCKRCGRAYDWDKTPRSNSLF